MTLKKKILLGYGVAFAFMSVVMAWAVLNLVSLGKATDAILRENYRSILAAEHMLDALERQDSGILILLLGDARKGTFQFRENDAVFLQWLARAKDNVTIAGEAELVRSLEANYARYRQRISEVTELLGAQELSPESSLSTYQKSIYPVFINIREECAQLRNLNEGTMYAASDRAGEVARRAIWSTVSVFASALGIALIFSLWLADRITRPLRRFMEASRTISAGNYSVEVPIQGGDELGRLAGEFNRMAAQLAHYHEMNIEQIISEQSKSEAILSSIEDGLVVFDTEFKATGINPAARRILGLEYRECEGLPCAEILLEANVCDLIRRTVENGMPPIIPEEQRIITMPTGELLRHYLFAVTVIRAKDRHLSGIVLLLKDVTRLKEIEQLKSEFVMAASHELRTPLTSMGMSIDLLLEHAAPTLAEADRELLQAAHEEVHRMKALVNDLLDLSKIEAGRIELEFESLRVQAILEYVQTIFANQVEQKHVLLAAEFPDDLPNIRADSNKISWVLTNLISNALRYVPEGGHILVAAKRIGPNIHLSVHDDGPGIPQEYQAKIFQKFVQVKGREAGGTGLGLAICKEIVRAHGGTIWAESEAGQGSTFTFTVPVAL